MRLKDSVQSRRIYFWSFLLVVAALLFSYTCISLSVHPAIYSNRMHKQFVTLHLMNIQSTQKIITQQLVYAYMKYLPKK